MEYAVIQDLVHQDHEAVTEHSEIFLLIQGVLYWTILGVGVLVPPIGALYALLT
jgi:hypothetical protein